MALQVPARFGPVVVVDERFVEVAHSSGLAVHVWTVDDPEEMEQLVGLGVDGIISDKPTVLIERAEAPGSELEGVRLSRDRSSASCRGWPSSSCGACASLFAWTQAGQCSASHAGNFSADDRPFGSVGLLWTDSVLDGNE